MAKNASGAAKADEIGEDGEKPFTRADFLAHSDQLAKTLGDTFRSGFGELLGQRAREERPAGPTTPDFGYPTDAEWDAAEDDGKAMRQLSRREAKAAAAEAEWKGEQKLAQVRLAGETSIAGLAARFDRDGIEEEYEEYKEEIEAALAQLRPDLRMNQAFRRRIIAGVLGEHAQDIKKRERQKVLREAADDPTMLPEGKHGRPWLREQPADARPISEIIGGEDGRKAERALNNHPGLQGDLGKIAAQFGMSTDEYRRRLAGESREDILKDRKAA